MTNKNDQIYRTQQNNVSKFAFDDKVASVFEDMISRSVPGYRQILQLLPVLVKQFHLPDGNYYDLGCSLGAGMIAISEGLSEIAKSQTQIIGIDNSKAMLKQAENLLNKHKNRNIDFNLKYADISKVSISNASMVLMNFTLQFIPLEQRDELMQSIFEGLKPSGVAIISEKIKFDDPQTNQVLIDIHHSYKAEQGYSELEISQKRDAIEDVLIPETLESHILRLKKTGFKVVTPWIQNLQFVSMIAIK